MLSAHHTSLYRTPHSCSVKGSVPLLDRRSFLAGVLLLLPKQAAQASEVVYVGPGQQYQSIAAAVADAAPGSTILVKPGRYEEQLSFTSSITLAAEQDGSVVIACNTQQPYRHCLELPSTSAGVDVRVQGISFEHYSKSVANNYCIFAQAGQLTLERCDISSSSGVGVGVEGASVTVQQCTIHNCERHGVAAFGSLDGAVGHCAVADCTITNNKLNGVLVKDGAELIASSNTIQGNEGYGVLLSYCAAELHGNSITRNKLGSIAVELGTVTAEIEQPQKENTLTEEVTLL